MPLPPLFIIIAIATALWQWFLLPRPRSRFYTVLGIIIVAALVLEIFGMITNALIINNTFFYNLFGLLEACAVLYMIGALRKAWGRLLLISAVVFIGAFIVNAIMRETVFWLLVEAILLVSFAVSLFLMAVLWWLAQNSPTPLPRSAVFWILLGMLIYFAGIVPTIGGYEFIYHEWAIGHRVFHIVQGLCVIRYLLTAYGLYLERRVHAGDETVVVSRT